MHFIKWKKIWNNCGSCNFSSWQIKKKNSEWVVCHGLYSHQRNAPSYHSDCSAYSNRLSQDIPWNSGQADNSSNKTVLGKCFVDDLFLHTGNKGEFSTEKYKRSILSKYISKDYIKQNKNSTKDEMKKKSS